MSALTVTPRRQFHDLHPKDQQTKQTKKLCIEQNWQTPIEDCLPEEIQPRVEAKKGAKIRIGDPPADAEHWWNWSVELLKGLEELSSMTVGDVDYARELLIIEVQQRQQNPKSSQRKIMELLLGDAQRVVDEQRKRAAAGYEGHMSRDNGGMNMNLDNGGMNMDYNQNRYGLPALPMREQGLLDYGMDGFENDHLPQLHNSPEDYVDSPQINGFDANMVDDSPSFGRQNQARSGAGSSTHRLAIEGNVNFPREDRLSAVDSLQTTELMARAARLRAEAARVEAEAIELEVKARRLRESLDALKASE